MMSSPSLSTWGTPSPGGSPVSQTSQKGSPRKQRKRSRREALSKGKDVHLTGPLSELTKHLTDVPIKDMETWVHRSRAERQREAEKKKKVARPMNSFMLYRSAYADRAKILFGEKNHQVVSVATGKSWSMEPKHIRDKYDELSRIERENHAATHPDYKFKPQKTDLLRARGELTPPASTVSGPIGDIGSPSDLDDSDFMGSSFALHHRSRSFGVDYGHSTRASTPFSSHHSFTSQPSYVSTWTTSYPPHGLPTVPPSALHNSIIEDVHFRRPSPLPQEASFTSSGLAGLPGAAHHELLQAQPTHPLNSRIIESSPMDPQLLSYDHIPHGLPVTDADYPTSPSLYPVWNELDNRYLATSAPPVTTSPALYNHPQGNAGLVSMQRNPSWAPNQHESNHVDFDSWIEVPAPASNH